MEIISTTNWTDYQIFSCKLNNFENIKNKDDLSLFFEFVGENEKEFMSFDWFSFV